VEEEQTDIRCERSVAVQRKLKRGEPSFAANRAMMSWLTLLIHWRTVADMNR
jgi:hypothetical protein